MDYMDPDVLCSQKADKLNLSLSLLGTNFSEILIKIQNVSFTKMYRKISIEKLCPSCPGEDELGICQL